MIQCFRFADMFYKVYPLDVFKKLLRKSTYFSNNDEEILKYVEKIPLNYSLSVYDEEYKQFISINSLDICLQEVVEEQGDKPYYIPTQGEIKDYYLKRYLESEYYNDYFEGMGFSGIALEFCKQQMYIKISCGEDINDIVKCELAIIEVEEEDLQEFIENIMNMYNDTRTFYNRGYKPTELRNLFNKNVDFTNLKITPASSKANDLLKDLGISNYDDSMEFGQKVYPNDPCPCGSGKKYKKCCMFEYLMKSKLN